MQKFRLPGGDDDIGIHIRLILLAKFKMHIRKIVYPHNLLFRLTSKGV